jgi:hypothetical protein
LTIIKNRPNKTVSIDPIEGSLYGKTVGIKKLCVMLKEQTQPIINEQKNERQNANASTKSKELHPNAQSRPNAAHLLLP